VICSSGSSAAAVTTSIWTPAASGAACVTAFSMASVTEAEED
jgi:hypothetical protein